MSHRPRNVEPKFDSRLRRTALRLVALGFTGLTLVAVPGPARSQSPGAAIPATLDSTMVNWHVSDNLRLEAVYGYSILDRFGLEGATQFFQFRIQTVL